MTADPAVMGVTLDSVGGRWGLLKGCHVVAGRNTGRGGVVLLVEMLWQHVLATLTVCCYRAEWDVLLLFAAAAGCSSE